MTFYFVTVTEMNFGAWSTVFFAFQLCNSGFKTALFYFPEVVTFVRVRGEAECVHALLKMVTQ